VVLERLKMKKIMLTLAIFAGLITPGLASDLTKAEWFARGTAIQSYIHYHIISAIQTTNLYAAVGKPDKTQSFGEDTLLYWFCQDGTICEHCVTSVYVGGWIMGHGSPNIDQKTLTEQ
jgi:hypothetical protein